MDELFVTCGQGLEPLLCDELTELGFSNLNSQFRGVAVRNIPFDAIYRINYCSRIASRVLLPLKRFRCYNRQSLYRDAFEIDWLKYIPNNATFAIDANVQHRELRNSLYAAQVVKDAICDQFRERTGNRPSIDTKDPDIQLNLFIHDERAILSFDTSGTPLHKRGYRQSSLEAPLRESIAAALLRLAEYRGDEIMCDPCCGSGTLLIEAALIATRTPPGFLRKRWGFQTLPEYSSQEWLRVKNEADQQRIPLIKGHIFGSDINKNAVHLSKVNLRAAGFHQSVEVAQHDFRDYTPEPPPTFLITNPPHGNRLGEVESLRPLYRSLGDFMKQKMSKPSRGYIFTGSLELSKEIGLAAQRRHVVDNAGIDSRLLAFDIF